MGLDMYLYRRRYVQNWDHRPQKWTVTLTKDGVDIPLVSPTYIWEQVGYWRKANAIHKFFVDLNGGVDNCRDVYVSPESLVALRGRCLRVLADHDRADELLPTQSGFFFGGTEYDEWYFKSLEHTAEVIGSLMAVAREPVATGVKLLDLSPAGSGMPEIVLDSAEYIYEASW